jgi:hypothetical protein
MMVRTALLLPIPVLALFVLGNWSNLTPATESIRPESPLLAFDAPTVDRGRTLAPTAKPGDSGAKTLSNWQYTDNSANINILVLLANLNNNFGSPGFTPDNMTFFFQPANIVPGINQPTWWFSAGGQAVFGGVAASFTGASFQIKSPPYAANLNFPNLWETMTFVISGTGQLSTWMIISQNNLNYPATAF